MRLRNWWVAWLWMVAAVWAGAGRSGRATGEGTLPALTVDQASLDAGEVVEGVDPSYTFTLQNQSDAPLKLKMLTSCGCAVAKADPEIAPGARSTLVVTLKTKGLKGRQNKLVVVHTEGPQKERLELRVFANVRPIIRVEPEYATYVPVRDAGVTATQFVLTPVPGQGVKFTEVVSNAPYVKAMLAPSGDQTRVLIWFTRDAPVGHLQATVTVVTNSEVRPRIGLTVTGEKGIGVSPGMFFMGLIPANATSKREEVTLRKSGGRFTIKSVVCDDPNVEITQETIQPGVRYRLVANYRGGWTVGLVKKTVTVTTDDPRQPVLTIPLQAVVSAVSASAAGR